MNTYESQRVWNCGKEVFCIRDAAPAEAGAISELLRQAFAEFESLYTPEAYVATVLTESDVLRRMTEGPLWVVEKKTQICGTVGAIAAPDSVMVRGMAVHPQTRGLGLAKALLNQAELFARHDGFLQLSLFTTPFLVQAIAMYKLSGFCFTGDSACPHGTELLYMTKSLGAPMDGIEAGRP
jgi:N-acetylglutamate synthase-like GNAT family acetyltransferase